MQLSSWRWLSSFFSQMLGVAPIASNREKAIGPEGNCWYASDNFFSLIKGMWKRECSHPGFFCLKANLLPSSLIWESLYCNGKIIEKFWIGIILTLNGLWFFLERGGQSGIHIAQRGLERLRPQPWVEFITWEAVQCPIAGSCYQQRRGVEITLLELSCKK